MGGGRSCWSGWIIRVPAYFRLSCIPVSWTIRDEFIPSGATNNFDSVNNSTSDSRWPVPKPGNEAFDSGTLWMLTQAVTEYLKKEQNTATLGLIWWFGRKQGTW